MPLQRSTGRLRSTSRPVHDRPRDTRPEARLWDDAGLLKYQFDDDTATDYEHYDAVAQDRAGKAAVAS